MIQCLPACRSPASSPQYYKEEKAVKFSLGVEPYACKFQHSEGWLTGGRFKEVIEPRGDEALLEEVRHWGWTSKLYTWLHFLFFLCFHTADAM